MKGSKQFRRIIYCSKFTPNRIENLRTVIQYANLTGALTPVNSILGKCLGSWNKSFLGNDLRNFLFLLRNNTLPLNNHVNAFDNPFVLFVGLLTDGFGTALFIFSLIALLLTTFYSNGHMP